LGKRLFIAVDVDQAAREEIGRISEVLRPRIEILTRASWVRPDRMHLTLHFSGSTDAHVEEQLHGALSQPIAEPVFNLFFQNLGFFPERGSPRVLWLGIRDGLDSLRRIQRTLADQLRLPSQHDGPFTPHLTLARLKDRTTRAKLAKSIDIPAFAGPSRIDRVTLYESRLSPSGPTYVPLAEALLRT
jgi:RNA 2',3'-cyclic 3'-phosphodiesterase